MSRSKLKQSSNSKSFITKEGSISEEPSAPATPSEILDTLIYQTPPPTGIRQKNIFCSRHEVTGHRGWILEIQRVFSDRSEALQEAESLISSRLNSTYIKSRSSKGLHVATARDPQGIVRSAAVIHCQNGIEIFSFATSHVCARFVLTFFYSFLIYLFMFV